MSSHDQLRRDYQQAFSTEHGARVLAHLAESFCLHRTTFSLDPHRTAFAEGGRNVILTILSMMTEPPKMSQTRLDPHDSIREEP